MHSYHQISPLQAWFRFLLDYTSSIHEGENRLQGNRNRKTKFYLFSLENLFLLNRIAKDKKIDSFVSSKIDAKIDAILDILQNPPTTNYYQECNPHSNSYEKIPDWPCYWIMRELYYRFLEKKIGEERFNQNTRLISSIDNYLYTRIPEIGSKFNIISKPAIFIAVFGYSVYDVISKFGKPKYYQTAVGFRDNCHNYIIDFIENLSQNITEVDSEKSIILHSMLIDFLVNNHGSAYQDQINELKSNIEIIINELDRIADVPAALSLLVDVENDLYGKLLKKSVEIYKNDFSGSAYTKTAEPAYIYILDTLNTNEKNLVDEVIWLFEPSKHEFNSYIVHHTIRILNMINSNSSMLTLINTEKTKIKEKYFRDHFQSHFELLGNSSGTFSISAEDPNRREGFSDLVIKDNIINSQMTISCKVWKRNFDDHPPVYQLIGDMGTHETVGILFMVNNSIKKKIDEEYIELLIKNHQLYVENSFKEINKNNGVSHYLSKYYIDDVVYTIHHIIFNIGPFIKTENPYEKVRKK